MPNPWNAFFSTLVIAAVVCSFCGCGVSMAALSERPALEQALVHESAKRALKGLDLSKFSGQSFAIDTTYLGAKYRTETNAAIDRLYVISSLKEHLVKAGLSVALESKEADLLVFPVIDYVGVDQGLFLLGVPAIALPLPGMNAALPELALIKRQAMYGRSEFSVFAVEQKSGKRAFALDAKARETYYSNWTALIFFGWRRTNLEAPF